MRNDAALLFFVLTLPLLLATQSAPERLHVQVGTADATDPPDTVRLINPLYGVRLPPHLQGSPSRNPPPRVFAGSVPPDERDAESAAPPKLSDEEIRKYEAAGAASGLPPSDDVWASLRDPLKGVKLATKKRRLKAIPNCFSGKEAIDWFLARYAKLQRAHGQLMMQQLMDKGLLLSATSKGPSPGLLFEDSDSFLLRFKVVNDSAGHLTLTIKEAAGLIEKVGDMYCNLDVRYKKSELSLTTNVWKTQLCKGPVPKWNATFKVPTRVLPQHLQFEAQVFAKHAVGANTFLGQVEVPLDPLTGGETLEDWFPLQMRRQGEEVRGEILLSLTFTSIDDDDGKGSKSSSSALVSSASGQTGGDADEGKKDDLGIVEVDDPMEVLAEIPYEFDNAELAGDMLVERNAAIPGGLEYKAASLVKLVELLSSADIPAGSTIVDDILCTYPTFTTGMRLFNLFLKRYIGPPEETIYTPISTHQAAYYSANKKDIQNRVGSFLARWMTSSNDFSDNVQLFSYFKKLVEMNFFDPTPSLAKYFAKKYEECRKRRLGLEGVPEGGALSAVGSTIGGKGGDRFNSVRGTKGNSGTLRGGLDSIRQQVPLLDLNTDEIAEQITLVEHQLFRAIDPIELLNQNWNKHPELSPHVIEYIQWFNKMCQWASTAIIKEDNPESRAVIVAKFIRIADRLAQLNNFNGLMEILASLEGSSIRRLKLTWAELPQADADTLERLGTLMKPERNFKDYRAAIVSSAGKPWIPYLGLHLTDLTFVDDGNTTWIGSNNNLVNLQKAAMSAQCVRTVLDSCKVDFYGIRPMNSIQKLLLNVGNSVFDENEVYRLSLLREARNAGGDAADRGRGNRNRLANIAKSMMKRANVAAEKDLTDADWSVVLEGAKSVTRNKDHVIIKQGELNTKMYMLQSGRVRVEKVPDGKAEPMILTLMEPPKVFGEMSIIMPNNKPAVSCVADVDGTMLYETDYTELHKAFALHPDLARRFYMTMAKKLSEMLIALVPPTKKKEDGAASSTASTSSSRDLADDTEEDSKETSTAKDPLRKKKKKKKPVAEPGAEPSADTPDSSKVRRRKPTSKKPLSARGSGTFSPSTTEESVAGSGPNSPAPPSGTPTPPPPAAVAGDAPVMPPPPAASSLPPVGAHALPKYAPPPPPPDDDGTTGAAAVVAAAAEVPVVRKVRKKRVVRRKRRPLTARKDEEPTEDDAVKYGKAFGFADGDNADKFVGRYDAVFKRYEGKLVVFERHVCFLSEMFMTTTKRIYPLNRVKRIDKRSDGIALSSQSTDIVFAFTRHETAEAAHAAITGLWQKVEKVSIDMTEEGVAQDVSALAADDVFEESQKKILTPTDWELMLNGAKKVIFKDGEFIIRAGESYQKIYHIVRGNCIVEVERDGQMVIINRMNENTTFGEMSFIKQTEDNDGYKASASVIAVDEVEISIIEGYFLNILFDMHPGLEVRFFEYLCHVLAQRIGRQTRRLIR